MATAYEVIREEAQRCASDHDAVFPNGCFIRQLNRDQPLRYLHKVYAPLSDDEIAGVADVLGFPPPPQYEQFLRLCGGASLFDRSMHIFGYRYSITRSLRLADQAAIQIFAPVEEFRSSELSIADGRWAPIGSIVLFNKVWMTIDREGHAALAHSEGTVEFSSFDAMIERVVAVLAATIGFGPLAEDGDPQLGACLLGSTH